MSKAQRDKGKRGELEVRDVFRAHGFSDVDRTPNSGGLKIVGDLYGQSIEDARLHVEVKRAETLALPAWTRQAEADCPEGFTPIVAYRRSNEPWRGSLDLNRLVQLLAIERAARAVVALRNAEQPAYFVELVEALASLASTVG